MTDLEQAALERLKAASEMSLHYYGQAWWKPRWEQTCLAILRLLNKKEEQ